MAYSEKVMEHFSNPRNSGELADANGVGEAANLKCGDMIRIYVRIENNLLADVSFTTFGCGAAVAASSMATELVKGKSTEEALKLTSEAITAALGGLPTVKGYCSVLAVQAIQAAVFDYHTHINSGNKQI